MAQGSDQLFRGRNTAETRVVAWEDDERGHTRVQLVLVVMPALVVALAVLATLAGLR